MMAMTLLSSIDSLVWAWNIPYNTRKQKVTPTCPSRREIFPLQQIFHYLIFLYFRPKFYVFLWESGTLEIHECFYFEVTLKGFAVRFYLEKLAEEDGLVRVDKRLLRLWGESVFFKKSHVIIAEIFIMWTHNVPSTLLNHSAYNLHVCLPCAGWPAHLCPSVSFQETWRVYELHQPDFLQPGSNMFLCLPEYRRAGSGCQAHAKAWSSSQDSLPLSLLRCWTVRSKVVAFMQVLLA